MSRQVSHEASGVPPSRTRRDNGDVWIASEYGMLVFLRLVTVCAMLWAIVGTFFYEYLLDYLGWNKIGIEARWSIFVVLSLVVAAMTAALLIGACQLCVRIYRRSRPTS